MSFVIASLNDICIFHMVCDKDGNFRDCNRIGAGCERSHNRPAIMRFFDANPMEWLNYIIQVYKFGKDRKEIWYTTIMQDKKDTNSKKGDTYMVPCFTNITGKHCRFFARNQCKASHVKSFVDRFYTEKPMQLISPLTKAIFELVTEWRISDPYNRMRIDDEINDIKKRVLRWLVPIFADAKFTPVVLANRSEHSWTTQRTIQKTEVEDLDKLTIDRISSGLNKISICTFDEMSVEIARDFERESIIPSVTATLIEKAAFEFKYVDLYCMLSNVIYQHLKSKNEALSSLFISSLRKFMEDLKKKNITKIIECDKEFKRLEATEKDKRDKKYKEDSHKNEEKRQLAILFYAGLLNFGANLNYFIIDNDTFISKFISDLSLFSSMCGAIPGFHGVVQILLVNINSRVGNNRIIEAGSALSVRIDDNARILYIMESLQRTALKKKWPKIICGTDKFMEKFEPEEPEMEDLHPIDCDCGCNDD